MNERKIELGDKAKMSRIHDENGVLLETPTVNYKYRGLNADFETSRKRYGCNSKKGRICPDSTATTPTAAHLFWDILFVLFQFRGKAKKDR